MTSRTRAARPRGDAGVTLMEIMVSMSITAVALVIIAGSFIAMYRATTKAESISATTSDVAFAFNRLDLTARYASGISQPGKGTDGNWYVEWSGPVPSAPDCTQLRLDSTSRQLQQRTWDLAEDSTAEGLSSWRPLSSGLQQTTAEDGSELPPFELGTDTAVPHQQIIVRLSATNPDNPAGTVTDVDVTFTALNSTQSTDPSTVCRQVARS